MRRSRRGSSLVAEDTILEGPTGFLKVYGGLDIADLGTPSGDDWDILTDMAVKLVPGGHSYHAFGEAAARPRATAISLRRRGRKHHREPGRT